MYLQIHSVMGVLLWRKWKWKIPTYKTELLVRSCRDQTFTGKGKIIIKKSLQGRYHEQMEDVADTEKFYQWFIFSFSLTWYLRSSSTSPGSRDHSVLVSDPEQISQQSSAESFHLDKTMEMLTWVSSHYMCQSDLFTSWFVGSVVNNSLMWVCSSQISLPLCW